MPGESSGPKDSDRIDFHFDTFGDLKRVFGPKRAETLLRTRERRARQGDGDLPLVTDADVDVARRFIRGETVGAQSGKSLRVFKHYFMKNDQRRKAFEAFLETVANPVNE